MTESPTAFWPSPQQNLIWSQDGSALNAVALISLNGPVLEEALQAALTKLVARHEVLRTIFRASAGMKVPFQVILDSAPPVWEIRTGNSAEAFHQELNRPFDLENGPVMRAVLIRSPADQPRAALIVSLPALLSDGDSLEVLIQELTEIYSGRHLAAAGLSYAQFAQWQNDLLEADDENAQSARAFWNRPKGGALVLPPAEAFRPASVAVEASFGGATADIFLAAWQTLLWRLTGQTYFETRVWFSGREYDELKSAPGLIGKFLPIPARFDGEFRFTDIVAHVHAAQEEAAEWQEHFTPGGEAGAAFEYRESHAALFTIVRQEACTERFGVKLSVRGNRLEFHYDASRMPRETMERWAAHYQVLLHAALAHPETPVARLPLLTETEKRQLLEDWNQTAAPYPSDRCLHELFELQAERTPNSTAVRCGDAAFTYSQLNERSNQLARHLRKLGIGPDSLVGLCLERGVEMMVAVLGILKAGGAYVPLNADQPKTRLAHQLTGAVALVTEAKLAAAMPDTGCPKVLIDHANWQSEPSGNLQPLSKPDNLMYVIYTSGSTGLPKGVGVRHRNLVNYAWSIAQRLPGQQMHFATVSTLSADLGNTCIYPALISGGCLHILAQDVASDSGLLAAYQKQYPIDVLKIVPSHLNALLETESGRGVLPLKHLITGGETLTWQLVNRVKELGATCEIWNHYGPTETTVGSLMLRLKDYSGPFIPIGRPLANTQVYIFDALQQPVPIGVTGELYISGNGVTPGYLNEPELTAARFTGGKYRTGDLARFGADGNVEFLGRADDQVKIRGYRIELGEIETVMARYPGVRQAVVVARPDERGDQRLIAYAVAPSALDAEPLRSYLKEELPPYMVPAALVLLPKLPLTANGKIDRQNLPEPDQIQARSYTAPRTDTEIKVSSIWCEVFRRERIGTDDNFFDIGGHSLLATQVISRIREHFQVHLDMTVLFTQPTIAGVSRAIDAASVESPELAIVPVSREAYRAKSRA